MSPDERIAALSVREREVLSLLADGCSNKLAAYRLNVSPRTVEIHRANVMEKLEATSFARALQIAFAAGMGEPL